MTKWSVQKRTQNSSPADFFSLPSLHPLFWRLVKSTEACPCSFSQSDLRLVDSELYSQLQKLRLMPSEALDECEMTFTLPGCDAYILVPGGDTLVVTKANLESYVQLVADAVLYGSIKELVTEFREAFLLLHCAEGLRTFSDVELSTLIVGAAPNQDEFWSLEHLQRNLQPAHGFTRDSETFKSFLEVMTELTVEQRRNFLSFVTGATVLPRLGFAGLKPGVQVVKKTESEPDRFLPSVMTCANYIKLPAYSSKEVLKKKLFQAIDGDGLGSFLLS